jgi:hypothetical protein
MKMTTGRRLFLSAVVLTGLMATTSWALTVNVPFLFPGINSTGNLDDALGTQGNIKANVNTKTGKFSASGKAKVRNQSGDSQTFTNVPVNIPNVTVTSSKYTVSKKGAATARAAGTAGT